MRITQHRKLIGNVGVIIILVLIAVVSCAQLLFQSGVPHTPNEDLARHVALALNFREALEQGQYIPRLQPNPVNLPDLPVYQYYGFLSSAVSQVGLWLHFPAVNSVILGVALCRAVGLMALYFSLKRIGVSAIGSIIACCAYIFFPYIQTNLYGRVAIPEACAHGLLPLLFLGYVYAITERRWLLPVLLIALGMVFLALSHPIFLLWGFVAGLVLAIVSLWMSDEYRYFRFAVLIIGLMFGLAISSFQWYPAFISSVDLNVNFTGSSPYNTAYLTSLSGFIGLPKKFSADSGDYFFTGAIWVLPVIGLAIFLLRKIGNGQNTGLRVVIVASLVAVVLFLFLSLSPVDVWMYLPSATYATQFPYRLLAFVGLFSAILLGLVLDKMIISSGLKIVLGGFIMASSGMSLVAPGNIFGPRLLQQSNTEIISAFSSADYAITEKGSVAAGDGWLIKDNLIHLPKSEKGYSVTVRGHLGSVVGAGDLSLWFVNPSDSDSVVSDVFIVNGNRFAHTFGMRGGDQTVRLISSQYVRPSDIDPKSGDMRLLSVMIDGLDLNGASDQLIVPSEIRREVLDGYTRRFSLGNELASDNNNMIRPLILTLPLSYSRFNEVTQEGRKLHARPNHAGLTQVNVDNMSAPVISVYRFPLVSTVVSGTAVIMFLFISVYCFLISDNNRRRAI